MITKVSIAGISYHGANTVLKEDRTHWRYSYVTFLSEAINKGVLDKNTYQYLLNNIKTSSEFEGFKKGKYGSVLWFIENSRERLLIYLKANTHKDIEKICYLILIYYLLPHPQHHKQHN